MLICEDPTLESAAMRGELCIAVPVSVYQPTEGECEITAYGNVWDMCAEFEKMHREDIFSANAVEELIAMVTPVADSMGYEADPRESRVIREYRVSHAAPCLCEYADKAEIIGDPAELAEYECPLLHEPDPDPDDDEEVCAVVIRDGKIVALAGINDIADDDAVEIFVETAKEYRQKGYGTAVVAALVRHLTKIGYSVAYNCADTNTASSAIAEKLGMVLKGKRLSVVCYGK